MSQTQLAGRTARVGTDRLSAYVVGQIERTTRQTIDIGDVLALALALDVTPADLLTETGYSIQVTDTVTVTSARLRAWLAGTPLPRTP